MRLNMSREELHTRGGLLDQIIESSFDAAAVIDRDCTTLFASRSLCELWGGTYEEIVGFQVKDTPAIEVFERVMCSGESNHDMPWVVGNRRAHATQIPIWEDAIVIGCLVFLKIIDLGLLKRSLSEPGGPGQDAAGELYDAASRLETSYTFADFAGKTAKVQEMLRLCRRAAATSYPILLIGETGTGKELLSHAIHSEGSRALTAPFIRINCTAIPNDLLESELFGYEKGAFTGAHAVKKGKFELAAGGSILLDEIGDMDLRLQGKLLRVLEEREFERVGGNRLIPFSGRIIASTNRNLHEMCAAGRFRRDLYFRLSALEIELPPLRERPEDVPLLVERFIEKYGYKLAFSPEAMALMGRYSWPGNVRQLKNVLTRLSVSMENEVVQETDLLALIPETYRLTLDMDRLMPQGVTETVGASEKERVENALRNARYNITAAARELNVTRTTLYSKIRKYGIPVSRIL